MDQPAAALMLANRLKKNLSHLAKWRKNEQVYCYRLYDADIPEFALALDIYTDINGETWVHAQEYEAPKYIDSAKAESRLRSAITVIKEVLNVDDIHVHTKVRRQQKGFNQYEKVASKQQFIQVQENNNLFWVNIADYLDTGLFLDHRNTRALLTSFMQNSPEGKCFLNLFAYTGSATVYAAKGGAKRTTTIDMSNTYLNWAQRNMEANSFSGPEHEFVQGDCMQWLDKTDHSQKYDLIFLDPPSFSTSKRMKTSFDVQRDHASLIRKTTKLLNTNGILVFSNNLRRFKMEIDQLAGLDIKNISRWTLPKDFERNPRIHNCWKITPSQTLLTPPTKKVNVSP